MNLGNKSSTLVYTGEELLQVRSREVTSPLSHLRLTAYNPAYSFLLGNTAVSIYSLLKQNDVQGHPPEQTSSSDQLRPNAI
jgi:hypothetical protein